jgi:alpha-glucosidase (family GH31 glycosyl hydrolase)
VIADLRERGVRVTAYINPYLNIKGDIYQDNAKNPLWLTDGQGQTLVQDFGQFNVSPCRQESGF